MNHYLLAATIFAVSLSASQIVYADPTSNNKEQYGVLDNNKNTGAKTAMKGTKDVYSKVALSDFDRNNDNAIDINEISEQFFVLFDADKNNVIDKSEFENARMFAITGTDSSSKKLIPASSHKLQNPEGVDVKTFIESVGLGEYVGQPKAISAKDLVSINAAKIDVNNNGIEPQEWSRAFVETRTNRNQAGLGNKMNTNN
jgi:hypothetical protein